MLRSQLAAAPSFHVIEPREPGDISVSKLAEFVSTNRQALHTQLQADGALLLRGFNVTTAADFERVALAFQPVLSNEYLGTSPRKLQPGCQYVFSASEFTWFIPIPQHIELSFNGKNAPEMIAFCCLRAPTVGGQTPFADFQRVYEQVDPAIRDKWEKKGIRYLRSYTNGAWTSKLNPFAVKRWDEVFQTTSREEAEAVCERNNYQYQWTKDGRLLLSHEGPATQIHPTSGKKIWFNHAHIFDHNMLPSEFRRVYQIAQSGRWQSPIAPFLFLLILVFAWTVIFIQKLFLPPAELATHVQFGDGTEIPAAELEHVRDVMWKNRVYIDYQPGDIVILDNWRISHGRMPYSGPRNVVVAWF